jgi:hypothetical protein
VGGGREHAHVGSGLGDDHFRGLVPDAGDGGDQVGEPTKGFHHHLDPLAQVGDRLAALVACRYMLAKKAWWLLNRPVNASTSSG